MKQQINLYQLVRQKQAFQLKFSTVFALYLVFLGLLLLNYFSTISQKNEIASQTNKLKQNLQTQKQNLSQMTAMYPSLNPADIEKSVKKISQQVAIREKLFYSLIYNTPFSLYLEGISKSMLSDIWLTTIKFNHNEQLINLNGKALHAVSIQQFLDRLGRASEFKNKHFNLIELSAISPNKAEPFSYLNFLASNKLVVNHE